MVEKVGLCNMVTLIWISEHHGIPGNGEANTLARQENNTVRVDQTADIPLALGKETIKSY
jgi:ribonuclease HI